MIGLTNSKNYKDIADAIRTITGGSEKYKPSEMAAAIRSATPDIPVMSYIADFGYNSSGQEVMDEKQCNLLAYAMTNNKDLIIKFKLGSSSTGSDDTFLYFYFGDYFRMFVHHSQHKVKFQLGGGSSDWVTIDASKECEIIIDHINHDITFKQSGETVGTLHWTWQSTTPLSTIAGSTAICANQNWLEYMKIIIK